MSALAPKADMCIATKDVCYGPKADIGALVLTAGNLMQTDKLMAGVVAISILGLTIGAAISWLERTLLSWR